ncbi:MAG: glucose/sorbosone dehydrogenase [Patescibacteria group bacterium]
MKKVYLIIFLVIIVGLIGSIVTYKKAPEIINPPEVVKVDQMIQHTVTRANGSSIVLTAPESYSINVAAEGLGRARFMAWSPDGKLFVTDMHDLSDNSLGKINILSGFDRTTNTFASTTVYASKLRNPNSVAFYEDNEGKNWIYIALTDRLIRYPYSAGDIAPQGKPQIIARFPDYGLSYKYGGWHLTRTVSIHDDKVYVSVGSSCNTCEEKEAERASIIQMNPDGSEPKFFARGLRNAVGLIWIDNVLYATNMGADHLGDDVPNDMFYKIMPGNHYGWPYCYVKDGLIFDDTSVEWKNKTVLCDLVPTTFANLPAHSAPLGVSYFNNQFLVALHGSGKPELGAGYKIVSINQQGSTTDFISGFKQGPDIYGRPVDILPLSESSFFFTDDYKGLLYFVSKK